METLGQPSVVSYGGGQHLGATSVIPGTWLAQPPVEVTWTWPIIIGPRLPHPITIIVIIYSLLYIIV